MSIDKPTHEKILEDVAEFNSAFNKVSEGLRRLKRTCSHPDENLYYYRIEQNLSNVYKLKMAHLNKLLGDSEFNNIISSI